MAASRSARITSLGADGSAGGRGRHVGLAAGGTGSVTVGTIAARGGSGTAGAGGDGGDVGDPHDRRAESPSPPSTSRRATEPAAGAAGTAARSASSRISSRTRPRPLRRSPTRRGDPVNGNLLATGGDGVRGVTDDRCRRRHRRSDPASRRARSPTAVRVDASTGLERHRARRRERRRRDRGRRQRRDGWDVRFSNAAFGAIRIEAHGDVAANADLDCDRRQRRRPAGRAARGGTGGNLAIASDRAGVALTGSVDVDGRHRRTGHRCSGVDGTRGVADRRGSWTHRVTLGAARRSTASRSSRPR